MQVRSKTCTGIKYLVKVLRNYYSVLSTMVKVYWYLQVIILLIVPLILVYFNLSNFAKKIFLLSSRPLAENEGPDRKKWPHQFVGNLNTIPMVCCAFSGGKNQMVHFFAEIFFSFRTLKANPPCIF